MEENFLKKQEKLIIWLIVVFLIFVFSFVLLILNKNKSIGNQKIKNSLPISPTSEKNTEPTQGLINLTSEKSIYNLDNQLIKIDVLAYSNKQNIVAYDLILSYDKELEFVKAESVLPGFQIFTNKKNNIIILTVGKVTQDNNQFVFNNEKILNVYFKPKNKGNFFVKIEEELQGYSTKFVNEKTEVLKPEVNNIKINVQ